LQLPFALVPLVQFTGDKSKMGQFANSWWVAALAWLTAAAIILLNALLILLIFRGNA
jgi:manganese transport protein